VGRHRLTENMSMVGRANLFQRNYEEGGRRDRRTRVAVGLEWDFPNKVTVETFGGYLRNRSTVDEKDYGGGIFGIQFTEGF